MDGFDAQTVACMLAVVCLWLSTPVWAGKAEMEQVGAVLERQDYAEFFRLLMKEGQ